jgi:hypothetical protein
VAEPLAGERALAALHPAAAEREDAQLRAAHPVRLRAPAAVPHDAGTHREHHGGVRAAVLGGRHPHGAGGGIALGREVQADLRKRTVLLEDQVGDAALGQRCAGPAAVEHIAAAQPRTLGDVAQQPLGRQVEPGHLPATVHDEDAGREELEDRAVRNRRPQAELGAPRAWLIGHVHVRSRTFDRA